MTNLELIEANRTDIAELTEAMRELVEDVLPEITKAIDEKLTLIGKVLENHDSRLLNLRLKAE